ncbi:MAG: metallophosphoesterase [bacterium]
MSFWFDLTIALLLAAVPLYLTWLHYRWSGLFSRGLHAGLAFFLVLVWLVVGYASLVETHRLVVRRQAVTVGPGDSHLSLAIISDSHLGLYRHADWLRRVVERINGLEPDAVLVLGDIADGEDGLGDLFPFRSLRSRYGTFAVLGNTDYRVGAVDVRRAVEGQSVEVLTNESVRLGDDGPFLVGLDDIWYGTPDWREAFRGLPEDAAVILAVHNPDPANQAEYYGVDLMLSGHTHGGQVRLPFVGPVVPLPILIDQRYDRGLFPYGPMDLFITSGVGESTVRARLLDPPEIVLLDIAY